MKFKYKVGEKVRVLDGSEAQHYTAGWVDSMNPYVGKILEVKSQVLGFASPVYNLVDGGGWSYDEKYLAPVSSDRIVVYIDKKDPSKVVAKDVSTGKTGVAKCSPEDTFDFYTGAKLAMERLLGAEKVGTEEKDNAFCCGTEKVRLVSKKRTKPSAPKSKFYVGQLVIGNEGANRYTITVEKTVWKVTAVKPNGFITISGPKSDIAGGFEVRPDCFDPYTGTLPSFKVFCTESKYGWQKGRIYSIVNGKCVNDKRYNPCYCISAKQMSDVIGVGFIRVME